uniref:Melatonin receptor 1B n=3 Tax=Passeriformes TaxID=9126 RepID=A0A8C3NP30_9PASS
MCQEHPSGRTACLAAREAGGVLALRCREHRGPSRGAGKKQPSQLPRTKTQTTPKQALSRRRMAAEPCRSSALGHGLLRRPPRLSPRLSGHASCHRGWPSAAASATRGCYSRPGSPRRCPLRAAAPSLPRQAGPCPPPGFPHRLGKGRGLWPRLIPAHPGGAAPGAPLKAVPARPRGQSVGPPPVTAGRRRDGVAAMLENGSLRNCCDPGGRGRLGLAEREAAAAGAPRPPWVVPVLSSVLIFTTVVDILGNLLVILSVFKNRKLRNSGNAFVVSLAVADLVVALYPYPLVLLAIFHNGWTLGETHCKASGFVMGLSVIGSIFNITAIAINRYCYICHSFAYDKVYSCWNTMLYVSLVWILTVIATVPNFFVGSLKYDPRIYSCTFVQTASSYYTIAVVVIHFIVPITIVSFCYLRIWVLVLQVRRRVKSETKPRLKPSDFRNFLTMFVVFVIFAFCWAPLNFIGLAVAIDPTEMAPKVPEWLFIISYLMAYFNSCLNAIIYGLLNQNFRNEYKRILMSLWMPRLFFQDTSKGGTDGQKSKPSPALNNNNQMKTETL